MRMKKRKRKRPRILSETTQNRKGNPRLRVIKISRQRLKKKQRKLLKRCQNPKRKMTIR